MMIICNIGKDIQPYKITLCYGMKSDISPQVLVPADPRDAEPEKGHQAGGHLRQYRWQAAAAGTTLLPTSAVGGAEEVACQL